jgi:6-phosphofructokinase 1
MVGSIDNDMVGTDMTIGADSALHRIVDAIDAISSTAASHQRSFVIEVMGRRCGYLAADGRDRRWVRLRPSSPSCPPRTAGRTTCARASRRPRRRPARLHRSSSPRGPRTGTATDHRRPGQAVLAERLGEDTRVTILGHVQRGGSPSAYDRSMATMLGYDAVEEVLAATPDSTPHVLGVRHNRIAQIPLVRAVADEPAPSPIMVDEQGLRAGHGRARRQLPPDLVDVARDDVAAPDRRRPAPPAPTGRRGSCTPVAWRPA